MADPVQTTTNNGQSRKHSAAEALANVAIGYGVAVTAQVLIFPLFGINLPLSSNLAEGDL